MSDVTISYKGNSIATMSASGTKTLLTEGKYCEDDITVAYTAPTPSAGSATTPATTITANPTISVSNSGLITATASTSQSITPTVVAGYVSSGTAGTVTVSGSATQQLTAKTAQTYTPTTTNQTIASGQYLTGAQTILGDANLLAENIKKDVSIFSIVGSYEGGGGGGSTVVITWTVMMGILEPSGMNYPTSATVEQDPDEPWITRITIPENSMFAGVAGNVTPTVSGLTYQKVKVSNTNSYAYYFFVGTTNATIDS